MTIAEFTKTIKELFPNSSCHFGLSGLDEEIVIYTGLTLDSNSNVNPIGE